MGALTEHKSKCCRALDAHAGVQRLVSAYALLCLPDLKTFAGPVVRPQQAWPKITGEKSEMQSRASRRKDGAVPWDCLALDDRQGCLGEQLSPALLPC